MEYIITCQKSHLCIVTHFGKVTIIFSTIQWLAFIVIVVARTEVTIVAIFVGVAFSIIFSFSITPSAYERTVFNYPTHRLTTCITKYFVECNAGNNIDIWVDTVCVIACPARNPIKETSVIVVVHLIWRYVLQYIFVQ